MKRPRLYIKIFFAYMALLVITEALIFAAFRHVSLESVRRDFHGYMQESSSLLRKIFEKNIATDSGSGPSGNRQQVHEFIDAMGRLSRSRVWLAYDDGTVISSSFPGVPPQVNEKDLMDAGEFRYLHTFRGPHTFFFRLPISFPGGRIGSINFLHVREKPPFHEGSFLAALAVIALAIAVLLYPLTMYITGPLKKLTMSAKRISEGDLEQMVSVKSRDEIRELADEFNAMAAKISRMIKGGKELYANISHELRSPLARMRVALEMMIDERKVLAGGTPDRLMKSVELEIVEMDRLIGQILLFSRYDFKGLPDEKREVDLACILVENMDKYRPLIERKGITLKMGSPIPGSVIWGRAEDLQAAMTNLLDNAVKFTPESGVIAVDMFHEGPRVTIRIFNTCRISPVPDLNIIFEPFKRIDGTEGTGTGLGLAISKKIVEINGGEIRVETVEGGIVFFLSFPLMNR